MERTADEGKSKEGDNKPSEMEEMKKCGISTNSDAITIQKEWDEICCPICFEHPHNAVLLICRSHEKGCRSYICDTSHRHSNCLDRFKSLIGSHGNSSSSPSTEQHHQTTDQTLDPSTRRNSIDVQGHVESNSRIASSSSQNILNCPLCRQTVSGWMIMTEARQYLDLKPRSCSRELCAFSGNYRELRQHARRVHPGTRPADVDPSRQRAWRRLEDEREYGDILSAIRSAMPGAIVLGDYAIDRSNDLLPRERDFGEDSMSWLTAQLLRVINGGFVGLIDGHRGSARLARMYRRSIERRTLWDQNHIGMRRRGGGGGGDDDLNLDDDDAMIRRRRRRFTRSRHNEEEH